MASQRPVAVNTLERVVPEWSARASTGTTSRTDAVRLHDAEPMEFILSSNWALSAEGVKDFYEVLYKCNENFEIQYDPIIQGFRVKCFSYNEVRIVALVKNILDQLVQKETEKGLTTSAKVTSLEDWRKNKFQPREETEVSEKYSFPRDVAACDMRNSWKVSENWFNKGVTTYEMLPENVLSKLQQLTSTVLVASSDRRTVYIGASTAEKIPTVKQKLDTLARFFSLISRDTAQVVGIFFYNEGDRSVKGEYRYVADGNDMLLRSYVLDRFDWPHPNQRYPMVFQKAVLVRLNPNNEPWEEARSLSNTTLPIVRKGGTREEFGAFKLNNWRYPARGAILRSSDVSTTQSGPNQITRQNILRPEIEIWVSGLPAPNHNRPGSSRQQTSAVVSETSNIAARGERNRETLEQQLYASAYTIINQSAAHDGDEYHEGISVGTTQSLQASGTGLSKPCVTQGRASQDCSRPPMRDDFQPTSPNLNMDCCADLPSSGASAIGEVTGNLIDSRSLSDDNSTSIAALKQPESDNECPFERLWKQCRPLTTETTSRRGADKNGSPVVQTPLPTKAGKPQLSQNNESDSRSYHTTMNQKAGSCAVENNIFPEFDPNMIISINKSLETLLEPLRMWSGIVDLKIDLGRFYFLNVKKSHVQEPGHDDEEKHYMLDRIRTELNKRHTANEKLHFTRVLTSLGADANHIAQMSDNSGNPMWKRPINGRSSTYEFICRRTLEGGELNFIVEIDATNFSHTVKEFKPDQNCFMIYCAKRVWDFRLVLSASQDLDDICQRFGEDLVSSLRVMHINDRLPGLEVSYNKSYNVEVLAVRTRNIACCIDEVIIKNTFLSQASPHKDIQRLYISEVWEMALRSGSEIEQRIQLKFARYKDNERPEIPLVWYEAALKSDTFSTAFEQNKKLELGNEVRWTSEELLKSGAAEKLIRKAATMIKNMDGVGFWNDNQQTELLRRIVTAGKPMKSQNMPKFW